MFLAFLSFLCITCCTTSVHFLSAGLQYLSRRNVCFRASRTQRLTGLGTQRCVLQQRAFHCSGIRLQHNTKTDRIPESADETNEREKKGEAEGEEDSGPEYIPKRKAKNPMKVIGYAWYE